MSAVESWFAPAAVAEPLPRTDRPRRQATAPPRPKARRKQQRGFRVRLPLVWMVVFALLLVGVVAVNVAVLRANVSVNDLNKEIAQLQQGNANLRWRNSKVTAAPRVEHVASHAHLVLVPSPTPIDMGSRK